VAGDEERYRVGEAARFDRAIGLLEEVRLFTVWGPAHCLDEACDVTFLRIDQRGQRLDLEESSSKHRFYSGKVCRWETQRIDYANHTTVEVFRIKIMPKE
jgi:hypothetical protein